MLFELFGSGMVSCAALATDMAVLRTLTAGAHWHYLLASCASFIAGAAVAYWLSVRFVFRFRHVSDRTLEFAYFFALGLVGLAVNAMVMSVAVGAVGIGVMQAKLVAAICTFSTNFFLRRKLLFSPARMST